MRPRCALIVFATMLLTAAFAGNRTPAEAVGAAQVQTAATVVALDLPALEKRLRDTKAIGVFTKLSLKNQVDDLLDELRAFHRGRSESTLDELHERYTGLMVKVLSLLQRNDPPLAGALAASRDAIWTVLTDPVRFSKLPRGG